MDGIEQEKKTFLNKIFKNRQNGTIPSTSSLKNKELANNYFIPADGGLRAWSIMIGSFFCNGILFGVINCYGILYSELYISLEKENVTNASGKAALAGSLAMGITFLMSPISGILTDFIGIRMTTFIGGLTASAGMFLSSFCTRNITAFCCTYGIMYGLGGSLAYTPSLAVLGHYFDKHLGIVNGVASAGSSIFTIAMPYALDGLLKNFGFEWTLRIIAFLAGFIMVAAILFKPVKETKTSIQKIQLKDIFNISVLTNTKYIIWVVVIGLCLFGYFIPYVYVINFVKDKFPKNVDKNAPVLCIGIMSCLSRFVIGYMVDKTNVNKILLQQIAFFSLGLLTILLPFSAGNFPLLVAICLCMGITDGCFISLIGPIAFDLCGRTGGTQAIGFLFGICSIPLTIGPYIAGIVFDGQQSYTLPFILAGINPLLASFGLLAIRFVKNSSQSIVTTECGPIQEPLNQEKITETNVTGGRILELIEYDSEKNRISRPFIFRGSSLFEVFNIGFIGQTV